MTGSSTTASATAERVDTGGHPAQTSALTIPHRALEREEYARLRGELDRRLTAAGCTTGPSPGRALEETDRPRPLGEAAASRRVRQPSRSSVPRRSAARVYPRAGRVAARAVAGGTLGSRRGSVAGRRPCEHRGRRVLGGRGIAFARVGDRREQPVLGDHTNGVAVSDRAAVRAARVRSPGRSSRKSGVEPCRTAAMAVTVGSWSATDTIRCRRRPRLAPQPPSLPRSWCRRSSTGCRPACWWSSRQVHFSALFQGGHLRQRRRGSGGARTVGHGCP